LNCKWIQLTVSENCHVMNLIKNVDAKLKLNYLPWNINLWININQSLSLSGYIGTWGRGQVTSCILISSYLHVVWLREKDIVNKQTES
jgi:hypothetical protein